MIQLGLDLMFHLKGFFTIERTLLNKNLAEMESLLGYEKGRLKQGADIFILTPPTKTSDFEIMGTTIFPGHRFEGSNLHNAINSVEKKEELLKLFQRQRLIKVVPLQIHMEAMRKFLTEQEYLILKDTDTKGKSTKTILAQLKGIFQNNLATFDKIKHNFARSQEIYRRDNINDSLYPSANIGIGQWKMNKTVPARCVCRLTDYIDDRYTKMF